MEVKIAIVIATHNRKELLIKLIKQIDLLSINHISLSIIIIDDGCTDGTIEWLNKNAPTIIIIKGTGKWYWTKCMNAGFKKAEELKNDYVLILNDDNQITSDYLQTLLVDLTKIPKNSILGSASISIEKPHKIESAGTKKFSKLLLKLTPYFKGFKVIDHSFYGIHKTWTLSGRGTLIPITLFKTLGYYDENLVQYGSDDEFCLRANINKIPVYISWNARVYNNTLSTSVGTVFKKEGFFVVLKSFFNPYSVNSLKKNIYLYKKYGIKLLTPFYLIYSIIGTLKSYYFNYK